MQRKLRGYTDWLNARILIDTGFPHKQIKIDWTQTEEQVSGKAEAKLLFST
jgi:hypothetical protein